jgi:hypothetical protein
MIHTYDRCRDNSGRGVGRNSGDATTTAGNWWVPESRYYLRRVHTTPYPGDLLRLVTGLPNGEEVKCGDGDTITSAVPEIRPVSWTWRCDGRRGYDWASMTQYLSTREPVHTHERATPRSSAEDSAPRRSCKKCDRIWWVRNLTCGNHGQRHERTRCNQRWSWRVGPAEQRKRDRVDARVWSTKRTHQSVSQSDSTQ